MYIVIAVILNYFVVVLAEHFIPFPFYLFGFLAWIPIGIIFSKLEAKSMINSWRDEMTEQEINAQLLILINENIMLQTGMLMSIMKAVVPEQTAKEIAETYLKQAQHSDKVIKQVIESFSKMER